MDWTQYLMDPGYALLRRGGTTLGGMVPLTTIPDHNASAAEVLAQTVARVHDEGLAVVRMDVFGPMSAYQATVDSGCGWPVPVLWVDGKSCVGRPLAGVQAMAVESRALAPVEWQGQPVGCQWETADARFIMLNDFRASNLAASPADQTREVLDRFGEVLANLGLTFRQVVRTWYYLDRLLDWYGPFNKVRTAFYREQEMADMVMPASTGIGAPVGGGSALAVTAFAVEPKGQRLNIEHVPSPLQCAATCYGSSFSRAIEVADSEAAWLSVSGTASIAPEGESMHEGNAMAQVRQTMAVVEAILASRCVGWEQVNRVTAYFKHASDAGTLAAWCRENVVPELPVVLTECDVCRDELLYEVELDAYVG